MDLDTDQKKLEVFRHAVELDRFYDSISWRILPILLSLSSGSSGIIIALSSLDDRFLLIVGWMAVASVGLWIWIAKQLAKLQLQRTRPVIIKYYKDNSGVEGAHWDTAWAISPNWTWPYWVLVIILTVVMAVITIGVTLLSLGPGP